MTWQWFSGLLSEPFKPMKMYLRHNTANAFRALLISGILLLLVGHWLLLPVFEQHREYYLWLAGLAATLGTLFIFAILSTQISGYRRYKDSVLGFATGMMFLLSGILAIIGLLHP
jgi:hypothetical protein